MNSCYFLMSNNGNLRVNLLGERPTRDDEKIHITLHPHKLRCILIHTNAPVPHYHNACPTTWTCITNTKQSGFHKHTVLLALPAATLPQDLNPSDKTWWQIKHTCWQVKQANWQGLSWQHHKVEGWYPLLLSKNHPCNNVGGGGVCRPKHDYYWVGWEESELW